VSHGAYAWAEHLLDGHDGGRWTERSPRDWTFLAANSLIIAAGRQRATHDNKSAREQPPRTRFTLFCASTTVDVEIVNPIQRGIGCSDQSERNGLPTLPLKPTVISTFAILAKYVSQTRRDEKRGRARLVPSPSASAPRGAAARADANAPSTRNSVMSAAVKAARGPGASALASWSEIALDRRAPFVRSRSWSDHSVDCTSLLSARFRAVAVDRRECLATLPDPSGVDQSAVVTALTSV
jgi:hypothetical protein